MTSSCGRLLLSCLHISSKAPALIFAINIYVKEVYFGMKKTVCFVICVIFVLALSATAFATYDPNYNYCGYGHVTSNNINLRSGAGTNYSSGGQVNKWDTFVVRDADNPSWVHVDMTSGQCQTLGGYLHTDYVWFTLY